MRESGRVVQAIYFPVAPTYGLDYGSAVYLTINILKILILSLTIRARSIYVLGMAMIKRIRDPIHGLITFDLDNEVDKAAWKLIDTPEFQRLRRVKQLGVSEFTFPGATHTRFAHSIGVFHIARQLMRIAKNQASSSEWNESQARTAVIAALLHDLGHGPFSHAFEVAEKSRLKSQPSAYKSHEVWTAELITNRYGQIRNVLKAVFGSDGGIADDVSQLLLSDPTNIYDAVVSSSFDADRLDYLQRDRMMTGSGAGAIDFPWLLDNLRVVRVPAVVDEGENDTDALFAPDASALIQTFAFEEKALQSVEAFILARYHLYSQVYFHRATRSMEQMLSAFLLEFAIESEKGAVANLSVPVDHPLRQYYGSEAPSLNSYLALDDAVVWGAIESSAAGGEGLLKNLAVRIRDRKIMKSVSIDLVNTTETDTLRRKFILENFRDEIGRSVFEDRAPLSIYKDARREAVEPHKRVYIKRNHDIPRDVAALSRPVAALVEGEEILRFYFVNESDRNSVLAIKGNKQT